MPCGTRNRDIQMSEIRRLYYSFGRHALLDALRLAGVSTGDTVALPAFVCRDVLAPIHHLGATATFYDVDRRLRPRVAELTATARAIVAVNYFGFPQHLHEVRELAARIEAVLIEDNAHGHLSRDEMGNPLGSRTGLGFTSFRKTLRTINGAYLDVDMDEFPSAQHLTQAPPDDSPIPLGHALRGAVSKFQRVTGLPALNFGRSCVRTGRRLLGKSPIPQSENSESTLPRQRAVHQNSLTVLDELDAVQEIARRRSLYLEIADRLTTSRCELVFESLPENTAPMCVPFFVRPGELGRAKQSVRTLGLEVFRWPDLPSGIGPTHQEFYSQVYVVNLLA